MATRSDFFARGFYKKPKACPYKFDPDGDWDIVQSVESCKMPVSPLKPMILETKFNGNRGIHEFANGKGCLFSGKKGCHDKGFPRMASDLLDEHLSSVGMSRSILDGEMYLESCNGNIPGLPMQARAIKGVHQDLIENCKFSYKIYDALEIDGVDLSRRSLERRKEALRKILPSSIQKGNVTIDPVFGEVVTGKGEISDAVTKLVSRGEEGIVMKDPKSRYKWKGRTVKKPSSDGWWKVKNASRVNLEAMSACLGKVGKTGLNAFQYRTFKMGACDDDRCENLIPITQKGVSLSTTDGDFSGLDAWKEKLHDPVVDMIKKGEAKPFDGEWRFVDDVTTVMGIDPGHFNAYVQGIGKNGKDGLPRCVFIPRGRMKASVVGLEFNPDSSRIPKINGPPRMHAVHDGKPSTIDEIKSLASARK